MTCSIPANEFPMSVVVIQPHRTERAISLMIWRCGCGWRGMDTVENPSRHAARWMRLRRHDAEEQLLDAGI